MSSASGGGILNKLLTFMEVTVAVIGGTLFLLWLLRLFGVIEFDDPIKYLIGLIKPYFSGW